ncbi:MAG: replication factor C large subunit [Candidatus Thorarchaeota archaeon]
MTEKNIPWSELYRPKNLGQVVGNEDAVEALKEWFDSWSINAKNKAALLHGPAGTGKTSSVMALAAERGYELVEMNASDTRNKDSVLRIAGSSAQEGTLTNGAKGKRILLIDEVDGITGREDRGGVKSLIDVISVASVPIICTANEAYDSKLSPLRKAAKVIAYRPIHEEYIVKVLKKIASSQKVEISLEDIQFIAINSGGDLRSAINDLEGMVLQKKSGKVSDIELLRPMRDQTKHLDEVLTALFKAKSFQEGQMAIDGLDIKYDELLLWIFENAHYHVTKEKLPDVYETLATADRFLGRIARRQSWNLLKYFFDLLAGVAVEIDKPKSMTQHVFPQKIGMYAQTKFTRAITDSITTNIAEKTHVSKSAAQVDMLYLVDEIINSNVGNAAQLAYWLELDDNQLKSLLTKPEQFKKIKQVMKAHEIEDLKQQTRMGKIKYSRFDNPGDDWSDIITEWEKKKEAQLEEEKRLKEEEKKKKQEAKKKEKTSSKDKEKVVKNEEKIEKPTKEKENGKQASLDQFF